MAQVFFADIFLLPTGGRENKKLNSVILNSAFAILSNWKKMIGLR